MILKVLVIRYNRDFSQSVILECFSKPQILALKSFVLKNARNFFLGRNQLKPIYSLKIDSLGNFIVDRYNELPVVLHHSYSKCNKELIDCKEVICLENVTDVLTDLHCTKTIDGSSSCVPGGINALSKTFNRKFFFKGVFKEIRSFLKDCESCRVNTTLPSTQLAPPQPIRSFHPHERIQYDLIDMAPRRRSYMKDNPWGFRYILSIKCCFSKFCWLFPLQRKTAPMVYRVIKFLFDVEGAPDILQSDNGKEFVNSLIKQLSKDYGFRIVRGKPYTPRHQGQVENLNKTVKAYLRRLLQGASEEEQRKIWPLLLPGIADKINKSYHFTIDDIPFRVYRNRDCNSLGFTTIPEDSVLKASSVASNNSSSDDEATSCADDGLSSSGEEDSPLKKEFVDCSATADASSQKTISATEIMQSCLGSSLSKTLFVDHSEDDSKFASPFLQMDQEDKDISEEIEVTSREFPSCLFNISKSRYLSSLKLLESTEMTIHQNIERDLKNCLGDKFSVGDTVLVKNPDLNSGHGLRGKKDHLLPLNVIAEVVEVLPSSMYKLNLPDSGGLYQKNVFQGEMVLFKANEDSSSAVSDSSPRFAKRTRKAVLEAISDFGLQIRRKIYKEKSSYARAFPFDIRSSFAKLFCCLDCGVLSELYGSSNPDQQRAMHASFLARLDELKQAGFPFFLYGTVAWERKRRVCFSEKLTAFLEEDSPHQCVDCFQDTTSCCSHYCCRQLALNFVERCGLKTSQLCKWDSSTAQIKKGKHKSPSNGNEPTSKRAKTSITCDGISACEIPRLATQPQSTLVASAEEKCNALLASAIAGSTRQLLEKFKLKLNQNWQNGESVNTGKMEKNLRYFLDVAFSTFPVNLSEHVKLVSFRCEEDELHIQMQGGGTAFCGMCALQNTIGQFSLSPNDFNLVTDNLWLEMAFLWLEMLGFSIAENS